MSEQKQVEVSIVRLYLKDLSFESPMSPGIFTKNFQPEIKVRVGVKPQRIQDHLFEVTLDLHIEGRSGEAVNFIVELEHAGLFEVHNVPEEQLDAILMVFCPQTIFPYARQVVDSAMISGGFPPLMMAPLDFESLKRSRADA